MKIFVINLIIAVLGFLAKIPKVKDGCGVGKLEKKLKKKLKKEGWK